MKKVFLLLSFIILFSVVCNAALTDNLTHVYNFETDPATSDLIDQIGSHDSLTDVITEFLLGGVKNFAWRFEGGNTDRVTIDPLGFIDGYSELTIVLWANITDTDDTQVVAWLHGVGYGNVIRSHSGVYDSFRLTLDNVEKACVGDITTTINNMYMVAMVYNGTHVSGWINATEDCAVAATGSVGADGGGDPIVLGANSALTAFWMDGTIDELYIYDRGLNKSELTELYNNGVGFLYPFGATSLELVLFDLDNNTIDTDDLTEASAFFIASNYTAENIPLADSICNFTAENISAHFALENGNVTLDGTNEISLNTNEGFINATHDTIEFKLCRTPVQSDVQILINGSLHHTVSGSVIPLCNAGVHNEFNVTTSFITERALNITLRCTACTTGNKKVTVVSDTRGNLIHYERFFTEHSEDMDFNSVQGIYRYDKHPYHFTLSGFNDIKVVCNGSEKSESLFVSDVLPVVNILSIDDVPYTDGMDVESNATTNIIIDVTGDIASLDFNVSYANGTLIKQVITEFMSLTNSQLNEDGVYNISIVAVNNDGNITSETGFFNINDTTTPMITITNPSEDNLSQFINNDPLNILGTFTDENLYIYWVNITRATSTTIVFNLSAIIFGNTIFNLNETADLTEFQNTTYILTAKVCDAHTGAYIKEANGIISNDSSLKFQFDNRIVEITSIGGGELLADTTKLTDRYYFDFYYKSKTPYKKYRLTSNKNIVYLPSSKYKGHFVIDNYLWVDFEQKGSVVVQEDNQTFTIYVSNKEDNVRFNSIGIINCKFKAISFDMTSEPSTEVYNINLLPDNFFNNAVLNAGTTSGVILIAFLFFVLLCFVVLTEYMQISVIGLFTGIYGFFFGMMIYVSISAILGVIFVILSLFYLILSIRFSLS